jgi:PAS domain S-box-containing protein
LVTPLFVSSHPAGRALPKRVLIADDNASVRSVIRSFIEREPGLEVCAVTCDGIETVDTAISLRPDLLIVDLLMPGLNGIEVASVLKNKLPKARIVLFTMYDDAIRALAPLVGANVLLTKSDGISALIRSVRTLLSDKLRDIEEALTRAALHAEIGPAHLEALARELEVPLTCCSRDLKYRWVNQQYADWIQQPVEKIVGRPIVDVLGKEAFNCIRYRFEQALSGQPVIYQADARYESIGRRRITAAYQPTSRRNGTIDGWLAFVEDVTHRVENEPAVAESNVDIQVQPPAQGTA